MRSRRRSVNYCVILQRPYETTAGLTVCNDFGNNVPYSAFLEAFSQIWAPIVFPFAEPRDDIWPTETAPVFRRRKEGVELEGIASVVR